MNDTFPICKRIQMPSIMSVLHKNIHTLSLSFTKKIYLYYIWKKKNKRANVAIECQFNDLWILYIQRQSFPLLWNNLSCKLSSNKVRSFFLKKEKKLYERNTNNIQYSNVCILILISQYSYYMEIFCRKSVYLSKKYVYM